MTDFSYSSWRAYDEITGNTGGAFTVSYGESSSNADGTLLDADNDDTFEGGDDGLIFNTGGSPGVIGNDAVLDYVGTIDISGTVYPVFQSGDMSNDLILFAQSDNELPTSINIGDIQVDDSPVVPVTFTFCFVGGTQIATPDGECAVEDLTIGDMITTAEGRVVPVKWIGRQRVENAWPTALDARCAPVCITKGALGNHTDLYVSADHGMIVDGLVINASALVNGTTIRFASAAEMPEQFTYFHIETENHDVILANGAASETFVDYAGRKAFDNYNEYEALFDAERTIPEMPRPRISAQRLIPEHIKTRLGVGGETRVSMKDVA